MDMTPSSRSELPTRHTNRGAYSLFYMPEHPNCCSTGYVPVHRAVVEKEIGYLLPKEIDVHHKNKNGLDNRVENLSILTRKEHRLIHGSKTFWLKCPYCGLIFSRRAKELPSITRNLLSLGAIMLCCSKWCGRRFVKKNGDLIGNNVIFIAKEENAFINFIRNQSVKGKEVIQMAKKPPTKPTAKDGKKPR